MGMSVSAILRSALFGPECTAQGGVVMMLFYWWWSYCELENNSKVWFSPQVVEELTPVATFCPVQCRSVNHTCISTVSKSHRLNKSEWTFQWRFQPDMWRRLWEDLCLLAGAKFNWTWCFERGIDTKLHIWTLKKTWIFFENFRLWHPAQLDWMSNSQMLLEKMLQGFFS